jgi:NAD(P)H-dependent flavin oxidoreductase YrpB (nitropropane dioxygenase family)
VVLDELKHPIVLAPLAGGASTPELTAAVSEAGGVRRQAARRSRRIQLWAGQAHELAPSGPAAEIVRSMSEGARRALEAAANRAL